MRVGTMVRPIAALSAGTRPGRRRPGAGSGKPYARLSWRPGPELPRVRAMKRQLGLILAAVIGGCGSESSSSTPTPADAGAEVAVDTGATGVTDGAPSVDEAALIKARPYQVAVPKAYDKSKPSAMILLLHGYGATGGIQLAYFTFDALVDARNVIIAYPDGTLDAAGKRYWNATDACCGTGKTPPDDVAYLTAVVHDVQKQYAVDPKRVFVAGHSNGGFMAHRLACERADLFAAAMSLAGAQWADVTKCKPSRPISIVQVHGDADDTIAYAGGKITEFDGTRVAYPSATETVAAWAKLDGCTGALADSGATLDLESALAGTETNVARYAGCPTGVGVELWTVRGGAHIPDFGPGWAGSVLDFLQAHPMP